MRIDDFTSFKMALYANVAGVGALQAAYYKRGSQLQHSWESPNILVLFPSSPCLVYVSLWPPCIEQLSPTHSSVRGFPVFSDPDHQGGQETWLEVNDQCSKPGDWGQQSASTDKSDKGGTPVVHSPFMYLAYIWALVHSEEKLIEPFLYFAHFHSIFPISISACISPHKHAYSFVHISLNTHTFS